MIVLIVNETKFQIGNRIDSPLTEGQTPSANSLIQGFQMNSG